MTSEQARYYLKRLKQRYLLLRSVEICLIAVSVALIVFGVAGLFSIAAFYKIVIATLGAVVAIALMVFRYGLAQLGNKFFASYLNQRFAELNESADLLLISETELSTLQQIQKMKMLQRLDQIFPQVKLPHRIFQSIGVFIGGAGLYFVLSSLTAFEVAKPVLYSKEIRPGKNPSSIFVKSLSVIISPPAYTNIQPFESTDFNLTIPEGSTVKWIARFSDQPASVKIFFSGRDSVALSSTSLEYSFQNKIYESGFYQLQWADETKTERSDFYKIEIVKDLAPKISIKDLNQFTKLTYTDQLLVQVKSELTDDYGLTDAQIIATVSKGSGEGVKFREEKLRFNSPLTISGKKIQAVRTLDLKKLGLEPSDELYFYVEAVDNKTPAPNRNRTETFFIAIQDTATEITSVDSGLGVDLMPEYFRSQRQIIIDTEKLLRDKRNIPVSQFNSTSNELGYDQKVLRLRYGQFLGEEDEAGIGQHAAEQQEEGEDNEQDPLKKFGHQHDTKNEHNLVDQKNQKNEHVGEATNEEEKEDPLKEFVHQHDNTEEATFFIQSLKTKLKAAITQMWDAELYLRLYQPEKSLPYQYRALNLLKEISSDSRIFVHRSGFDPPPLKEEKRLTADLSEVKTHSDFRKAQQEEKHPAIRNALAIVERMITENSLAVSARDQKFFARAGQELSGLAIEQPLVFLKGLSLLKSLSENSQKVDRAGLLTLRALLYKTLPPQPSSPSRREANRHALNKKFLKTLDQTKHE